MTRDKQSAAPGGCFWLELIHRGASDWNAQKNFAELEALQGRVGGTAAALDGAM
jgi:hypothetical protein